MARNQYYCPNCEAPEAPVLIETPYYSCPQCKQITPRDQLTRKRIGRSLLAGSPRGGFVVVNLATATLYDASQLTDQYNSESFSFVGGDGIVVGLASFGGAEVTNPPVVTLDGIGAMLEIVTQGADGGVFGGIYFGVGSGSTFVNVQFGGLPNPVSSALFVTRIRRASTPAADGEASAYSASTSTPTSGLTAALAAAPEAAIALLARAGRSSDPAGTWLGDFSAGQRAGTDTGTNDCIVFEGRSETTNKDPISASASIPESECVCAMITVRA